MAHIVRRRTTRAALGLSAVLALSTGVGTGLAGAGTGSRDIQDYAQAAFIAWISECLVVDSNLVYVAGDNLQDPVGSGKPRSWADALIRATIVDACDNDAVVATFEGLAFPDVGPDFDRLERASLDVSQVTLSDGQGGFVDAEIHLAWVGTGPETVRIDHQRDRDYFRQERSRSASVTGTVEFGASAFWSGLTLLGEQSHDANIGTANEISLP